MHYAMPHHDTRRGSSRFKSEAGYAVADSLPDHRERERALDAVRAAALRREDREQGVPSAHQVASALADACSLLLDPRSGDANAARALGVALKRVLRARGVDGADPAIAARFECRLRPLGYVVEHEERRRADLAIARARKARDAGVDGPSVLDLYAMLRDDADDDE